MNIKIVLFSLLLVSAQTLAAQPCSEKWLKRAEKSVLAVHDRFRVGEVTQLDVKLSQITDLDIKNCAGKISVADYCKAKLDLMGESQKHYIAETQVGARPQAALDNFNKDFEIQKLICQNPPSLPASKPVVLHSCTAAEVSQSQTHYNDVIQRFKIGETTVLDVRIAKSQMQDQFVCAGLMTKQNYCKLKPNVLEDILSMFEKNLAAGSGESGVIETQLENFARMALFCQ